MVLNAGDRNGEPFLEQCLPADIVNNLFTSVLPMFTWLLNRERASFKEALSSSSEEECTQLRMMIRRTY